MRTLFGPGAIGECVRNVQQKLTTLGFDTKAVDGCYGQNTLAVVKQFQMSQSLSSNGIVDERTWQLLMQSPPPSVTSRCLQLTASIEGHGYGLAVGDFDGAILTWGIIGFTMAAGKVQEIVLRIHRRNPQCVEQAFQVHSTELLDLMTAPLEFQKRWAAQHTLRHGALAEPWKSMFEVFGSFPEVQQQQRECVQQDYMKPAIQTARALGLRSESGQALCFDIHVQNGGIKRKALASIRAELERLSSESDLRIAIANVVVQSAKQAWREDVRNRKMAIATGLGVIHGHSYMLNNWGLSGEIESAELLEQVTSETALGAHA